MKQNEFELINVTPARHKGEVFSARFICTDSCLYRLGVTEALCHEFVPGDSAYMRCQLEFEDTEERQWVTVYLTGDILHDFVEKHGVKKLNCELTAVTELKYEVSDMYEFNEDKEYYGYHVLSVAKNPA